MSNSKPVEMKNVRMPMIDDAEEAVAAEKENRPPKNAREAIDQIKNAKTSSEKIYAIAQTCGLCCLGMCILVFMAGMTIIHIYLIILGSINVYNCPLDRRIPIFLIIAGAFGIFRAIMNLYYRIKYPDKATRPQPFSGIVNLFLICWLVTGSTWIFRREPIFDNQNSKLYCDKLTYYTAVVYISVCFILIGLMLIVGAIVGFWVLCTMCMEKIRAVRSNESRRDRRRQNSII